MLISKDIQGYVQMIRQLFERSRFANEIGAAIHITPNANSALLNLGIDATTLGAVESEKVFFSFMWES